MSVKLRSFRAFDWIVSSRLSPVTAEVAKIVVAVLRPSDPNVPNLGKSERWRREWVTRQERQKTNGVGMNAAARPPGPMAPSGFTVMASGTRSRRGRKRGRCSKSSILFCALFFPDCHGDGRSPHPYMTRNFCHGNPHFPIQSICHLRPYFRYRSPLTTPTELFNLHSCFST